MRLLNDQLPAPLQLFENLSTATRFANIPKGSRLEIAFPSHGSELELGLARDGSAAPIVVKLQGGVPPFRLMANDRPLEKSYRRRQLFWVPDSEGITKLTVLDSVGQARAIEVRVR